LFISAAKTFLDKQSALGIKNQKKTPGGSVLLNNNPEIKPAGGSNQEGCC
jgi:hypothetical protein